MIFTNDKFEDAMNAFLAYADTLLPYAVQSQLDQQEQRYEKRVQTIMEASDTNRQAAIVILGRFTPDKTRAEDRAKTMISVGIGSRVRGAIACHGTDDVECARLLMMAQAEVFRIIGMPEGARAIDEGANLIYERVRHSKKAA